MFGVYAWLLPLQSLRNHCGPIMLGVNLDKHSAPICPCRRHLVFIPSNMICKSNMVGGPTVGGILQARNPDHVRFFIKGRSISFSSLSSALQCLWHGFCTAAEDGLDRKS